MNTEKSPPVCRIVSPKWQMLLSIVFPINIWAFYRIQKLRMATLLLASAVFGMLLVGLIMYPEDTVNVQSTDTEYPMLVLSIAVNAVFLGIPAYLIYRWSKKWNKELTEQM